MKRLILHLSSIVLATTAFIPPHAPFLPPPSTTTTTLLGATTTTSSEQQQQQPPSPPPQIFTTSHSTSPDLIEAISTATKTAFATLPLTATPPTISLALITLTSLYDGGNQPLNDVLPTFLASLPVPVQTVLGCTAGGVIAGTAESEGVFGVSVTLAVLPDVQVKSFYIDREDVPDEVLSSSTGGYLRGILGLGEEEWGFGGGRKKDEEDDEDDEGYIMLMPSPAFQNELDDFLRSLSYVFPSANVFGGIASTVSSLSRARLFRYDGGEMEMHGNGCIGIAMKGDIVVRTMVAQGAKPVGHPYRIVAGDGSTIRAILHDDTISPPSNTNALIPKPPLAEANFLMKTLSDDDQAYMRKAILLGVENGGAFGRTPNELERLSRGEGHRFTVHRVASAGMKDGSVTLPLGSVSVEKGQRCQFFVRDGEYARREVEALWMGYKKVVLENAFNGGNDEEEGSSGGISPPTGCLVFPTLDRGAKMFGQKGYESGIVAEYLGGPTSVSGFYTNGVIGEAGTGGEGERGVMLHGSASLYAVFGSRSKRPLYDPSQASKDEEIQTSSSASEETPSDGESSASLLSSTSDAPAPRLPNGELLLKRREVHSGRAISVSTVEWSVAEKIATPTSVLEGFMWDKEAEVDRYRERVPLQNLVSQWKMTMVKKTQLPPRDFTGGLSEGEFIIIPECKKMEPGQSSFRKRYEPDALASQFAKGGAPIISVNADQLLFGGKLEHVTSVRGTVANPILASDLVLYPYQLYKLRLAGADAVTLLAGALAEKDLRYLTKIAKSLGLGVFVTVTTEVQVEAVTEVLDDASVDGLILSNRDLETFLVDETGQQVLDLLDGGAMKAWREKFVRAKVLVEGRVGVIGDDDGRATYIKDVQKRGADGCIMGRGLALLDEGDGEAAYKLALEYLD